MFLGIPPVFSERQLVKKRESVRCLTLWCNARYAKSAGFWVRGSAVGWAEKEKKPWGSPLARGSGAFANAPRLIPAGASAAGSVLKSTPQEGYGRNFKK